MGKLNIISGKTHSGKTKYLCLIADYHLYNNEGVAFFSFEHNESYITLSLQSLKNKIQNFYIETFHDDNYSNLQFENMIVNLIRDVNIQVICIDSLNINKNITLKFLEILADKYDLTINVTMQLHKNTIE